MEKGNPGRSEWFGLYRQPQVGYTSSILVPPPVRVMPSRVFWSCPRLQCRPFLNSAVFAVLLLVTGAARLGATEPNIYLIERFSSNQVTLHFNTDANRTYSLQYLDSLSCPANGGMGCSSYNVPSGSWSNLWVAPRLAFPNHYVVTDYRTNRMRFYRLKVTP